MISIEGTTLDPATRERLRHPDIGGVILFSRNYENPQQLTALCADIRALRTPPLLLAVDQEGGAVQRLVDGFTRLPEMASIGRQFENEPENARALAESVGVTLALELGAVGIDFSFAPVLDLASQNKAIGTRAFHRDPQVVRELSDALVRGLRRYGMQAVAKHFPGHSGVEADPHFELPTDFRSLADLRTADMVVYESLETRGIHAVMTCHVMFPNVDSVPATFSARLVTEELRQRLSFNGLIISDDVMMGALGDFGTPRERVIAAREAGCDLILLCNDDGAVDQVIGGERLPDLGIDGIKRIEHMRKSSTAAPPPADLGLLKARLEALSEQTQLSARSM